MNHGFLPISRKEMEERGWNQVDFVYVSGDAYVDHPSFGHAIIGCWRAEDIGSESLHSLTGRIKKVLQNLESRGLDLWCRREIWIPWSTIILYQRKDGSRILIHRAE